MRVGIDVAPLVQTAAGTARHVTGLVGALEGRPGLELQRLTFGGPGRASTAGARRLVVPGRARPRARGLDLLHCTTFRAPRRSRVPLVVTVHDLALLRHPEAFPVGIGARSRCAALRRTEPPTPSWPCRPSPATSWSAARRAGEPCRVVPNGVDAVFTHDGPRREGSYVLAVGTLEPRKNLGAAVAAARIAGVELRAVGAVGWGGVDVPGWVGRSVGRDAGGALSRRPLSRLPVALRGLRHPRAGGDGLRHAGRDEPRRRHRGGRGRLRPSSWTPPTPRP